MRKRSKLWLALTGSGNGSRTVPDRIRGKQSLHPEGKLHHRTEQ